MVHHDRDAVIIPAMWALRGPYPTGFSTPKPLAEDDDMTTAENTSTTAPASLREWWDEGFAWPEYEAEEIREHRELWQAVYRKSDIPEWALYRLDEIGRNWKLLVIAEDWCGDASNLVPIVARLAEASSRIEMRIVKRDDHPELMDRYLTNGSRSIPIVVVADDELEPVGRWGPRPTELQDFVIREKRAGERPAAEIYKDARRWYARDRGETTLRELLDVMASAV